MPDCDPKYVKAPPLRPWLHVHLHKAADETNDARDHDELHAAAAVVAWLSGAEHDKEYIYWWLDGLKKATGYD